MHKLEFKLQHYYNVVLTCNFFSLAQLASSADSGTVVSVYKRDLEDVMRLLRPLGHKKIVPNRILSPSFIMILFWFESSNMDGLKNSPGELFWLPFQSFNDYRVNLVALASYDVFENVKVLEREPKEFARRFIEPSILVL